MTGIECNDQRNSFYQPVTDLILPQNIGAVSGKDHIIIAV